VASPVRRRCAPPSTPSRRRRHLAAELLRRIEDVGAAARIAHDAGALLIVVADPLALGILATPGEEGADIAVGEGQSLGNYQDFGGPGFGFFAARKELTRRLPGRIVGETVDGEGRRGFVLTLQTREQHIRRESATSNICSNHALNALAGLVYLSWLGKEGLPALGLQLARSAAYLRERLLGVPGIEPYTRGPVFRELAVTLPVAAGGVVAALAERGYLAGLDLGRFRPDLGPRPAARRERAPHARRDRRLRRGGEGLP